MSMKTKGRVRKAGNDGWRRRAEVWHVSAPLERAHTSRQRKAGRMRHPGFLDPADLKVSATKSTERTLNVYENKGSDRKAGNDGWRRRAEVWHVSAPLERAHTSCQTTAGRMRHPWFFDPGDLKVSATKSTERTLNVYENKGSDRKAGNDGWRRRAVSRHVSAPLESAHTPRQRTAGRVRHPWFFDPGDLKVSATKSTERTLNVYENKGSDRKVGNDGWRRRAVGRHVSAPLERAHTSRQRKAGRMRHPGFLDPADLKVSATKSTERTLNV
jgi:hypothetical protein